MSYQTLIDAVIKGDIKTATEETLKAIDAGQNPQDILDQGLIELKRPLPLLIKLDNEPDGIAPALESSRLNPFIDIGHHFIRQS